MAESNPGTGLGSLTTGTPDLDLSSQEQRAIDRGSCPELLSVAGGCLQEPIIPERTSLKFVCLWLLSQNGLLREAPQRQRATRVSSRRVSPSGLLTGCHPGGIAGRRR